MPSMNPPSPTPSTIPGSASLGRSAPTAETSLSALTTAIGPLSPLCQRQADTWGYPEGIDANQKAGSSSAIPCDGKVMTVRRNIVSGETEYLGIVGQDYGVVQNEQCAEILDRLVDEVGGAHFQTAGSLRRGRSVFVTMKLPQMMTVAGVDSLDLHPAYDGGRAAALAADA